MLKEGDKAPQFKGIDQDENPISLEDFSGRKLILYFYPKDDTPGCTAESCSLRDNYSTMLDKGYAILGVSADTAKSHRKFIKKYKLPFSLLADTNREVIDAFGVWGPKKFMGREYDGILRTTFVINEQGVIEEVYSDVNTKDHANQILENQQ
ncbi:MAG: thioredoxin-dependent thiol peroxidase [Flavobacteriales bacterium]|nr:thioredoxin-dependent thiol peroxidase [Flavobacteriales bacterium]